MWGVNRKAKLVFKHRPSYALLISDKAMGYLGKISIPLVTNNASSARVVVT